MGLFGYPKIPIIYMCYLVYSDSKISFKRWYSVLSFSGISLVSLVILLYVESDRFTSGKILLKSLNGIVFILPAS